MRILRHKHNRKTLAFYRLVHGLHPPYKVVVDGTFLSVATRTHTDVLAALRRTFEDDTLFVHVTECVLRELEALGPRAAHVLEFVNALLHEHSDAHTHTHAHRQDGHGHGRAARPAHGPARVRVVSLIQCSKKHGHGAGLGAAACLLSLVGERNHTHVCVATQDAELRTALRARVGVPLCGFANNVLLLEPPSAASRAARAAAEDAKTRVSAEERAALRAAMRSRESSEAQGTRARPEERSDDEEADAATGGGDADAHTHTVPPVTAGKRPREPDATVARPAAAPRPRNPAFDVRAPIRGPRKPRAPNPLSVRKPKPRPEVQGHTGGAARKRRRSHAGDASAAARGGSDAPQPST